MKLSSQAAPHIWNRASDRTMMLDMMLTLSAIYFMAFFYYGPRAIFLGLCAMAVCWLCDAGCILLRRQRINLRDLSSLVTGMIIPLLMPASISYEVVVVASVFSICFVKHPFGGLGNNLFNPAAAGVAFAIVCWPTQMFSFPPQFTGLAPFGAVTATLTGSNAYMLYAGNVPITDYNSILLGASPGPMGAANVLVSAACLLYLAARGTVRFVQPLFCLGTVALLSFTFPRVDAGGLQSVFFELMCTSVVFCATFMFTDPVTSPGRGLAKALYGVAGGVIIMAFRWFGGYEETACFALLLLNALAPAINMVVERWAAEERRVRYGKRTGIEIPKGEEGELS